MPIEDKIEIHFRGIAQSKSSSNGLQDCRRPALIFESGVGVTFKTNQKYVFVRIIVLPPVTIP